MCETFVAGTNLLSFPANSLELQFPTDCSSSRPRSELTLWWRVDNQEKKAALRGAALMKRNALTRQQTLVLSQAIQIRALQTSAYRVSHSVALYSAIQNEVRTEAILEHALASGRRIYYPRTAADGNGEFIKITSAFDLCAGRYGIREPTGTERFAKGDNGPLIIFVPGVAFDQAGNRLGRGQGWYDRLLAHLQDQALVVALAYQFQIVEKVPINEWDRKVHCIVTEQNIIVCDANSSTAFPVSRAKERGCFN
jgi:5-formyltetrahydrofolate cyclo-ligase